MGTMPVLAVLLYSAAFAQVPPAADESERESLPLSLVVDYEVGPLYVVRSTRLFGEGGTTWGASDVGEQRNLFVSQRLSLELQLGHRHELVFLYAPLELDTRATLAQSITFNQTVFAAGTVVDSRYLFDGYRASYLFLLVGGERLKLQVGASVQVRNAQIALSDVPGTQYQQESDIGVVPALKARLFYIHRSGLYAMLDADGLTTFGLGPGSGGLYDVALTLGIPIAEPADLFFRLRSLGGGVSLEDRVFENFANFVMATIGLRVDLVGLF